MTPSKITVKNLRDYFESGCKNPGEERIGLEHEKLLFKKESLKRADYQNDIAPLLTAFLARGWSAITEGDHLIGAKAEQGSATLTLEPAGQFELSGAPHYTLHDVAGELDGYLDVLGKVLQQQGLMPCAFGYDPLSRLPDRPWMPKARYDIMGAYMPTVGRDGLEMMTGTTSIQVNLDYRSEADMVRKMRVAMALQPMITALFATSPLAHGDLTPYASYRGIIWQNTDAARCGFLPFVFDHDFGFDRYVAYLLSVPMYFVRRQGRYVPMAGQSFQDFMDGTLEGYGDLTASVADFADHGGTAFPDVRLRTYLEIRGADGGGRDAMMALGAFFTGLFYDDRTLMEASDIIGRLYTVDQLAAFHQKAPVQGLKATVQGHTLQAMAQVFLPLARRGLLARGLGEESYLNYLDPIVRSGASRSDHLRHQWEQTKQNGQDKPMDWAHFIGQDGM